MAKETYNGWTNYETWRVQLEIMDGYDYEPWSDLSGIADQIQEIVEETVLSDAEGLAHDYASAFLSKVNYYELAEHELAEHALTNYPSLLAKIVK